MNHRYIMLSTIVLMAGAIGCTGPGGTYNNPGMFSDVNGARIAPPGTGTVQYPQQVASLPDPYYGQNPARQPAGWQPSGVANPANQNPITQGVPAAPANTIPSNNLVVASSTSGIQPGSSAPTSTTPANPPPVVAGGMPLTDATRVATVPAQQNNVGIFNRTWEYVARPTAPNYAQQPYQYATQPVYANGPVVASSTTPGFSGPRPSSYATPPAYPGYQNSYPPGYQTTYPGYPNVTPVNNAIADGWRQRDVSR